MQQMRLEFHPLQQVLFRILGFLSHSFPGLLAFEVLITSLWSWAYCMTSVRLLLILDTIV